MHPNELGEKKMSEKWLRAIAPALGSFKIALSYDSTTRLMTSRNFAGVPNQDFVSVITNDPANGHGGLGTGWFGGLHISWSEVAVQATVHGSPFSGQLDRYGASAGTYSTPVPLCLIAHPKAVTRVPLEDCLELVD